MSKKGKRLREFEKNNRTFNVSEASERRANKRAEGRIQRRRSSLREVTDDNQLPQQRKKKRTKVTNIRRFLASVIILALITFVVVSGIRIIKLTYQRNELQATNTELLKLKEDLAAEFDHINSAEYIEQQARKELKMIKENEILFIVDEEE